MTLAEMSVSDSKTEWPLSGLALNCGWTRGDKRVQALKGPKSADEELLVENGNAIMRDLQTGLQMGWQGVTNLVSGFAGGLKAILAKLFTNPVYEVAPATPSWHCTFV